MNRKDFAHLTARRLLRLDGATGTELAKLGLTPGVCPEAWIMEHPKAILQVQRSYMSAGSNLLYVPSFGANPFKLAEFGLEAETEKINTSLAQLSRKAFPGGLIFGDLAPTGKLVEPFGELGFEECVAGFRKQAAALIAGGVDGFVIETMLDLQEARAALIAVRELSATLPVMVTLTFEPGGRTMTGTDPVAALTALQALGADAFGCNCSTGPAEMAEIIRRLKPYATIPLIAKPNAGMPRLEGTRTVFDLGPSAFARAALELAAAGAGLIGGCCGTTPAHIGALNEALGDRVPVNGRAGVRSVISASGGFRRIASGEPFTLIGERINPTGKKALQAELRGGSLEMVRTFAREQVDAGAPVLDVNLGLAGIDEAAMMREAVAEISRSLPGVPLCIDSTSPAVVEAALRLYPGRALLNSISAEKERLEKVLPIAAKYGAMLVLLPLSDDGIPATCSDRIKMLEKIMLVAGKYGYRETDFVVDALVMTISADPAAALSALEFIRKCSADLKLATVCGLSNVSFGLPNRPSVNLAFLGLAIGQGLCCAIANPLASGIGDFLAASDALLARDEKLSRFLARAIPASSVPAAVAEETPERALSAAILNGERDVALRLAGRLLEAGWEPFVLVNEILIPAIAEVGGKFERKEFFLPQLMHSAEAMRRTMEFLEPRLRKEDSSAETAPVFLIATVKGDIHDIGKNIVALLLRNYGFTVVDLGKDVAPEAVVEGAKKYRASFIGLSALMTTTMPRMRETVELLHASGITVPVFVGGAAVDAEFAASIGAEFGADAMSSVRRAIELRDGK